MVVTKEHLDRSLWLKADAKSPNDRYRRPCSCVIDRVTNSDSCTSRLILEPADKVFFDRDSFLVEILDSSKKENRSIIAKHKTEEVYDITKNTLKSEIVAYQDGNDIDISQEAFASLKIANSRRMSWSIKRNTGVRKAGPSVQKFLVIFAGFLESYSGIVELVKAADNQYGGLAYGTLSLFLGVCIILKV